jgi:hypothetical protein
VVARRDRVLAILESGPEVRGRWIELDGTGRWGERTAALPIGSASIVLAPDGTRVAGIAKNGRSVAIVDLARGRVIERPYKRSGDEELLVEPALRPIGFLTNDVLGIVIDGDGVTWWGRGVTEEDFLFAHGPLAVGDRKLVGESSGTLVLAGATDEPVHFLGYRMGALTGALPSPSGILLTDGRAVVETDASLHTRAVHEMPAEDITRSWYSVTFVDRTHVLAGSYARGGSGFYLVDLETRTATLVSRNAGMLGYEASTRVLAYQTSTTIELAVYDPRTHTFSPGIVLPFDVNNARVKLLDPTKAKGNVLAITTNTTPERVHVQFIKSFDPSRDQPIERGASRDVRVDEAFWDEQGDSLAVLDRLLPPKPRISRADGALSAELHDQRITLRDKSGTELWTVPSVGATDIVWTPDGSLVAYGAGLARFDLASGALADRQCGWRFGRWKTQPEAFGATTMCDAPEHF